MPPPLGNVWNIVAVSCILGHLLTNFRDSEKEFSAHTSVFHWNYSSALCWGMVGGIPSRKIDKFTCFLLDSRAFSGLNSNKFRSFLRNQLLLFPTQHMCSYDMIIIAPWLVDWTSRRPECMMSVMYVMTLRRYIVVLVCDQYNTRSLLEVLRGSAACSSAALSPGIGLFRFAWYRAIQIRLV